MWVTTGVRWSGMTTTSSPFARVKWDALGAGSAAAGAADQNAAASATARTESVGSLLLGTENLSQTPPREYLFGSDGAGNALPEVQCQSGMTRMPRASRALTLLTRRTLYSRAENRSGILGSHFWPLAV